MKASIPVVDYDCFGLFAEGRLRLNPLGAQDFWTS